MSTNDMVIANQGFPAFRADLNAALQALASTSKGTARPATPYAGQLWLDDNTPNANQMTLNQYDGTDDIALGLLDTAGNRFYPRLHKNAIHGLAIANNGTDALNDIDIAVGTCRDSTDVDDMHLLTAITKRLDAVWAVGTAAGGLDTGAEATSTLYAVWLIKRSDTGVVDALFSLSFTAPTMPASYDRKRLIGTIFNDAALAILAFTQSGDYFRYMGAIASEIVDATITSNTYEPGTLNAPPLCLAHIYVKGDNATATTETMRVQVRTAGGGETVGNSTLNFVSWQSDLATDALVANALGVVMTNASRQVEYAALEASGVVTISIATVGFHMLTRSAP